MRFNPLWPATSWVFMLLMMIGRLLLWAAVIYSGWRYLTGRTAGLPKSQTLANQEDRSLAILRQRLASGEISVDEFDRIKEHLRKCSATTAPSSDNNGRGR